MVISRIRQHVVLHNWFAVFVDLVIVVVGVFLGTQANNWNDARIERNTVAEFQRDIIADLKANELDLASRKIYYSATRAHALAALAAIESPASARNEKFLVDAYQATQVWSRPLTRAAYDEMAGAGLSRSVGDKEMRARLTAYYTQIRQFDVTALGLTSYRERLRRALPYSAQEAIRRKCGDRVTTFSNGAQLASLPESCSPGIGDAEVAAASSNLLSANLNEDLVRHIADLDQKIAGFERFGKLARGLRSSLEAAGGG